MFWIIPADDTDTDSFITDKNHLNGFPDEASAVKAMIELGATPAWRGPLSIVKTLVNAANGTVLQVIALSHDELVRELDNGDEYDAIESGDWRTSVFVGDADFGADNEMGTITGRYDGVYRPFEQGGES